MNTLKLELHPQEVEYIANILGQRPWTEVQLLMTKLQQQVAPQMKAAEAPQEDSPGLTA